MAQRRVRLLVCILTLLAGAFPAAAQLSNASLKGAYSFRYLGVSGTPCDCPLAFIGTLTFDGSGGYTVSGQGNLTTTGGTTQTLTPAASGKYNVFSSGMFSMDNPFSPASSKVVLYGGVGQGAIVASSTEAGYLDNLVAIPAATAASNATLTGTYQVASLEFGSGSLKSTRNTFFTMTADGNGGLGNVSVKGTSLQLNNAATTQTSTAATYTVTANGSGTLNLPAPSGVSAANQLLAGTKTLYVSADGNIFVAGAPSGFDLVIGIKALPSPVKSPVLSGLFFYSELENCATTDICFNTGMYGYWGATNELGDQAANELLHGRVNYDQNPPFPYDLMINYAYTFNNSGVSSDFGYNLAGGGGGNFYLLGGSDGDYFIGLGTKVQPATGTGPFILPTGVVNAATNAPFTAQLSPGEVITLYGTNLAPAGTNASASAPFPATLSGVGVTINGTPAPVYSVTPNQINAVVPYTLDPTQTSVVNIQVTNGSATSNTVTEYLGFSSPGVFTVPAGGLGNGAILHADFSLVNTASPAKVGETVQIFLTGLGAVSPAIAAGAPASSNSNSLNLTVDQISVYLTDPSGNVAQGNVVYSGLAPGLGGLYQLNVTIPTGLATGLNTIEVDGSDAVTIQATIPIGK